ncbi:MAG: membrane protein insertase YidC [Bacteroidales bacterium]|jgi:YidC/Oxa1 family membrane protein insertase|nr:membrane protein insertase YidC [Bacteroidales bacterium]
MDKNSVIGMVLIFVILIGFSYLNKPTQEEIEAARQRQDSLRQVELALQREAIARQHADSLAAAQPLPVSDSIATDSTGIPAQLTAKYGAFAKAAAGEQKFIILENNLMQLRISSKGGRVYSVLLKNYKTFDGRPLLLFDGPLNQFGLSFFAGNRPINTGDLYFSPSVNQETVAISGPEVRRGKEGNEKYNAENPGDSATVSMYLTAGDNAGIEYRYTLRHNSYMVGFDISINGMEKVISPNTQYLNLLWTTDCPRQERKSKLGEDAYTSVNYKYLDDDVERLSERKSSSKQLETRVEWISFKQLFFNSALIPATAFPAADVTYEYKEENANYVGKFSADVALPYEITPEQSYNMRFYFGPNHFQTLSQYDISLENVISLGYSILRPINRYLIIPVFNFFRNHIANFGMVILLLTIVIRTIIFPFAYKSNMSMAKMRVLKPEIDELSAKFPPEKSMEKQQAVMALYQKAGINPMGGCLPMLLQMPILFAMFFFFPSSIELRQESFLWAKDLSSYDSILNLPFTIPWYGSHVSLFCLLMTITTILSTMLNSPATSGQAMPGMKTMMYIMPVMFLFILNSYPSGLSYYYLLSNLIAIGQTFVFRKFTDDNKIRLQLAENRKKTKKKSRWQIKMEELAKQAQANQKRK